MTFHQAIYSPRVRQSRQRSHFRQLLLSLMLSMSLFGIPHAATAVPNNNDESSIYRTVNFQVNYRDETNQGACETKYGFQNWTTEAKAAMNHVVDILDDLLNSSVTIVVDACYQLIDPQGNTLAWANPQNELTQSDVSALPIANRVYPIALANAISGADQNATGVELVAVANSAVQWDYCITGCVVASDKMDFVSTMVHEVLHGLGFKTTFHKDTDTGTYGSPPSVIDDYVIRASDSKKLLDFANNSADLLAAMQMGSGTIALNAPSVLSVNRGNAPFLYTPNPWEDGSSMSHWDDNHPTNLGRMMNAATGNGPSSRIVDAITLEAMKDIGWSVNDGADHGDGNLSAYGDALHINDPGIVNFIKLGTAFSKESVAAANDDSDDGVTQSLPWSIGTNGGQINVSVSSTQSDLKACLSGWIDWNQDNVFDDNSERILHMAVVSIGTQLLQFTIPNGVTESDSHNARIRLVPDWDGDRTCNDQVSLTASGGEFGGEVEDYQWRLDGTPVNPVPTSSVYLPLVVAN